MTRRVPLGAALFFALLVVTMAAAVLVVRARSPDLVLEVERPEKCFAFSPETATGPREARITFFSRRSDPAAVVGIVDAEEHVVRTLDPAAALESEVPVTYVWDGRTDGGETASPGRYRLAVELPESERSMVWPLRIFLYRGTGPPPIRKDDANECVVADAAATAEPGKGPD